MASSQALVGAAVILVTTAETNAYAPQSGTTVGPSVLVNMGSAGAGAQGILIYGYVMITPGTGTTTVTIRVRVGGSLTGTQLSGPAIAVTAGVQTIIPFWAVDPTPLTTPNYATTYMITAQQTGATGNGTIGGTLIMTSTVNSYMI